MTSLVTGANGFVGSALCRALCARQQEVRAFVRQGSDTTNLADLPVTLARGDLRDRESLHRAMEGCQFVYHVAADYRLWVPDPGALFIPAVLPLSNQMLMAVFQMKPHRRQRTT